MSAPIFVLGASRGIGFAVVERLVKRGQPVIAVARNTGPIEAFAKAQPEGLVTPLALDLSDPVAVEAALGEGQPVAGVVVVAAVAKHQPVPSVKAESFNAALATNVLGSFFAVRALAPRLQAHGGGAVVILSTTLALKPIASSTTYSASKAALESLVRSLALEYAPTVRVTGLRLGGVDTPLLRAPRTDLAGTETTEQADARVAGLAGFHPLKRLGTPDEAAHAVEFLLNARWMTGTILTVDGGLSLV